MSRPRPRQTWSFDASTDLDEWDIDRLTGLVANTIPDRNPVAIDYAYGDPREVTSAHSFVYQKEAANIFR